jgi:hypothetical protein
MPLYPGNVHLIVIKFTLLKLEFTQGKLTEEMFINRIICYEALEEFIFKAYL